MLKVDIKSVPREPEKQQPPKRKGITSLEDLSDEPTKAESQQAASEESFPNSLHF